MPPVDLTKMTKDELLRFAARKKFPVNKAMLKGEILASIKREMKKAARKAASKQAASKQAPAQSPKGSAKKPVTGTKKITAKTQEKSRDQKSTSVREPKTPTTRGKQPTSKSKTAARYKKKPSATGKKTVPSRLQDSRGASAQSLLPKFELEDSAQEAKFIIGHRDIHDESHAEAFQELPDNYGDNKLVLLVRDPYWCFLYWELQDEKIDEGLHRISRSRNEVRHVLRIHCLSAGSTYFDVDVDFRSGSHYIQLSPPGASFYSEIGLLDGEGNFAALAISNTVTLPLDGPSEVIDEQWMTTSENFEEIYALSGGRVGEGLGIGGSEKQQTMTLDFSSSVSSFSSQETRRPAEKFFNHWLDAELVLFGGADPGSTIQLAGQYLQLRPDGTFSTRISLPEGSLQLPVTFVSPDKSEVKTITPKIDRKTTANPEEVKR